jgi:acyl-CoA thioesterase-1
MLAGGCESRTPASPTAGASRIVVLGDSLALSPRAFLAFPVALQGRLASESLPWIVKNASGWGDTTAEGRARLDAALAQNPSILIVELGGNDGLQGIALPVIRANLSDIVSRARARGARVLLCGMETGPFNGIGYMLDFHDLFREVAREQDVPLVPFLLAGVLGNRNLTADDLLHPNTAGARRIAENIWPYLEPMVRAPEARAGHGFQWRLVARSISTHGWFMKPPAAGSARRAGAPHDAGLRTVAQGPHAGAVHRQGHGAHRREAPRRQQHVPPPVEYDGDPARLQDPRSGSAQGGGDSRPV